MVEGLCGGAVMRGGAWQGAVCSAQAGCGLQRAGRLPHSMWVLGGFYALGNCLENTPGNDNDALGRHSGGPIRLATY